MGISVHSNSTGFVMSELSHITHQDNFHIATVGSRKGRTVPLTHHIFRENFGWVAQPSSPHPTLSMITTACPEDHDNFGHPVSDISSMTSCVQISVCDTGCMSATIPPAAAHKVGFKRKDIIPMTSGMNGAGKGDLGVVGAVVMQFHMVTEAGQDQAAVLRVHQGGQDLHEQAGASTAGYQWGELSFARQPQSQPYFRPKHRI